jgi:NADH:quinone reductase (non-electrogenic)
MCTKESPIHENIKQAIVDATEKDTALMFRTMHNTARYLELLRPRVFKNKVSVEVVRIEKKGNAKFEDIKDLVSGERGKKVYVGGDKDYGGRDCLILGIIYIRN